MTYTEQQAARIRAEWFPKHKAKLELHGDEIEVLTWKNPDNSNYWCRYMILRNTLFVQGDIGEAIYTCGQQLQWSWLAGLDLDYFAGKCQASETGRLYKGWDAHLAQERFKEFLAQNKHYALAYNSANEDGNDPAPLSFREDLNMWLARNVDDLGLDFCADVARIGEVVHIRCHGHLLGIKMAHEKGQ